MKPLRAKDHLFEAIVQTVRESLLILTPTLKIQFANDSFYRAFSTNESQTLGRPLFEIGGGQWDIKPLREQIELLVTEKTEIRDFEVFQTFEGIGEKTMIINARRLAEGSQASLGLLLIAIEDATVRRVLERERDEAFRSQEELVGIVSHEIKNPLTTIITSLDIIRMTLHGVGIRPELPKMIDNMYKAAHRMERITGDLLDMTKIDAGKLVVHWEDASVRELLDEVGSLYEPEAKARGIQFTWQVPDGSGSVFCDRDRIIQVLGNLLSNALKFTAAGGAVQMRATRKVNGEVQFDVQDTGIGISPSELDQVFGRFWQAKHKKYVGAGLGLYISNRLIAAHGGSLRVVSRMGEGSTFSFQLPEAGSRTQTAA